MVSFLSGQLVGRIPVVDWSGFPPEGSTRPGGRGLEAAARRYLERQAREAKEKEQAENDGASLATTAVDDTAEPTASEEKGAEVEKPESNDEPKEKRGLWRSMKKRVSGISQSKS
ncbi:hypothetical protein AWENTII_003257 [Aspergillus wentii]